MADRDPSEALARVADMPEHPDAAFADRLLEGLIAELTSSDVEADSDDPGVELVPIIDRREDSPMRKRRWTWVAAAAAVVVAVVAVAIAVQDDDDTVVVDQPSPTVAEVREPSPPTSGPSTPTEPNRTGPTWCARTRTVLADIDDDGNFRLEALQAWVEEAPPEIAEVVQAYDGLVRTAPPIRAADPDFETEFADARAEIDAYVAANC